MYILYIYTRAYVYACRCVQVHISADVHVHMCGYQRSALIVVLQDSDPPGVFDCGLSLGSKTLLLD